MATLYVNLSGNDSNNGSTPTLAKKTIQAAITASVSNDTILVGSGSYNEKLILPAKNLILSADGVVVLDGTGIASNPAITQSNNANNTTINAYTTGGLWIFQNHVATVLLSIACYSSSLGCSDCLFLSNSNTSAAYNSSLGAHTFTRCVFSGFINAINSTGIIIVYNCTFYNCTTGLTASTSNSSSNIISLCIFSTCTTAWNNNLGFTYLNNNLYYNITNWKIGANIYTTLAQVQAVNVNYDSRSLVADPQFTDPTNNIFYLKTQSAVSPYVGCYPYSFTQGAANDSLGTWNIIAGNGYDNTGWYLPSGSNITKNGTTGYFELTSGTVDEIWSPVYDLGNSYPITKINLESNQTWPTNMVDQTKTDIRPNRQSMSVRASASSFAQNDAVIAWTEVYQNLPMTTINGRFVQLRLTLRSDDVGA